MNILGITCEYNPLHNGHLVHLNSSIELTKPDAVIVALSSNFMQRGIPSIVDKHKRTKMALSAGADVVFEIPSLLSAQSAEIYARAAVKIFQQSAVVTDISFGCETVKPDYTLKSLTKAAKILNQEPPEYKSALSKYLNSGYSYPKARNCALHDIGAYALIDTPNAVLSLEYIRALDYLNSNITPHIIKRLGKDYHDYQENCELSSATAIRNSIISNRFSDKSLPDYSYEIIQEAISKKEAPVMLDDNIVLFMLRRAPIHEIAGWMDVSEGLENRIKECALSAGNLDMFFELVKTKRYTHTRIQRIITHGLLKITKAKTQKYHKAPLPYLRLLGFKKSSDWVLSEIKRKSKTPILSKAADYKKVLTQDGQYLFEKELLATSVYSLFKPNKTKFDEFYKNIVIL